MQTLILNQVDLLFLSLQKMEMGMFLVPACCLLLFVLYYAVSPPGAVAPMVQVSEENPESEIWF